MTTTDIARPMTAPAPVSGLAQDLSHVYCCIPNRSICGLDISNLALDNFDTADCVVCAAVEDTSEPCSPTCLYA
ncbi:hypothetical protein [Kitasatospora sp. NPDC050543]|uniref:hypothetical protein n=1 Tax=Kitasatospora sp. NPDC050543 TaxID=3364054 RepID=UPI0037AAC1CC